ncbi:hypothetical protein VNO80_28903 [Phaseolus coccineus]|uniref:Uncharacterized protein n=1 Tax=Phaseolus coccineus TaxID=3886 RepID=A0AAN9L9X7_PHACN
MRVLCMAHNLEGPSPVVHNRHESLEDLFLCRNIISDKGLCDVANKLPQLEELDMSTSNTMPGLRHLQLFGNKLTNDGLLAILDCCPHLESLDLRQCFNVKLGGSLSKRCAEQIKDLRIPYNPTDEYPFEAEIDYGSLDEDYPSRISDIDFLSDDHYEFSGGSDSSECDYDNYLHWHS